MRARLVDTTAETVVIRRRRLPHWRAEAAIYFVTFRLADALPSAVLIALARYIRDNPVRARLPNWKWVSVCEELQGC